MTIRTAAAALTVAALSACGPLEMPDTIPAPAPPGEATVTVAQSTVAQGSAVQVEASGMPASATVEIGMGMPDSDFSIIREAQTDAQGQLNTTVTVPEWTMRGHPYVVVVRPAGDQERRAVSDPFVVGSPGDPITVEGTLTEEGVECPALRDRAGTLYTLAIDDLQYEPGTNVRVEGTIAEVAICMQGTTIQVERIERR